MQIFSVTIVTHTHNAIKHRSRIYMNDRQARAAQSKLNLTSCKTVHYCIPAAQLDLREVTRPSISRRLKGVACETMQYWRQVINRAKYHHLRGLVSTGTSGATAATVKVLITAPL